MDEERSAPLGNASCIQNVIRNKGRESNSSHMTSFVAYARQVQTTREVYNDEKEELHGESLQKFPLSSNIDDRRQNTSQDEKHHNTLENALYVDQEFIETPNHNSNLKEERSHLKMNNGDDASFYPPSKVESQKQNSSSENNKRSASLLDSLKNEEEESSLNMVLLEQFHSSASSNEATLPFNRVESDHNLNLVAMGIPEEASSPPPREGKKFANDSNDTGYQNNIEIENSIERFKTEEELNQIEIDNILATNISQNQVNAKDGKKVLPEIHDPSMIIRRHLPFRSVGSNEEGQVINEVTDMSHDFTIDIRDKVEKAYGSSTAFASVVPPLDLGQSLHDDSNQSEEGQVVITASAGIPVISSRPGAYAIPGIMASTRNNDNDDDSQFDDYSTYYDEASARMDRNGTELEEAAIAISPNSGAARTIITGRVINEEDQLTDEERKSRLRYWRKIKVIIASVTFVIGGIVVLVFAVLNNNKDLRDENDRIWKQIGLLNGYGNDDNIRFGTSVSLSKDGKRLVAGLPGFDDDDTSNSDVGQVQVFELVSGCWRLFQTLIFEAEQGGAGETVAISGDGRRIVVGSPSWSNGLGLVTILQEEDGKYYLLNQLKGEDNEVNGNFGGSLDISQDGKVIAITTQFLNTDLVNSGGIVRVYSRKGRNWVQMGQDITSERKQVLLGTSISLSQDGKRLAVGIKGFGYAFGQVNVYNFNNTHWNPLGRMLDDTQHSGILGDVAVSLNSKGDIVAIGGSGSAGADSRINSGKVQVFQFDGEDWNQMGGEILGNNDEYLGDSVALSDEKTLVVGSPQRGQSKSGQIKIFRYEDVKDTWEQIDDAINSSIKNENFGASVSISSDGRIIAAGAPASDFDGRFDEVGKVRVYQQSSNTEGKTSPVNCRNI